MGSQRYNVWIHTFSLSNELHEIVENLEDYGILEGKSSYIRKAIKNQLQKDKILQR